MEKSTAVNFHEFFVRFVVVVLAVEVIATVVAVVAVVADMLRPVSISFVHFAVGCCWST